ncbi:MAG: DUF4115 domain-containing protein [Deferribacteres bacterium]|nr:DUF4115 domain-containing protein [Deferribacteres bacterium]
MDTPGSILKTERKKQKKSLKGIARALKIKVEYLRAIEEDDYRLLPAEIYTKAYLRLYADLLGLESNFILDLYRNARGTAAVEEPEPPPEPEPPAKKPQYRAASAISYIRNINIKEPVKETVGRIITPLKKIGTLNYKPLLVAAASLLLIGISAVFFMRGGEEKPVTEPVVRENGKAGLAAESEKLSLKITAVELTWVSVSIDGGKRREWLLRPGETVTLSADKKFVLKVGNAGGTRIVFNNRDIGKLGPPGKVVDIVLP